MLGWKLGNFTINPVNVQEVLFCSDNTAKNEEEVQNAVSECGSRIYRKVLNTMRGINLPVSYTHLDVYKRQDLYQLFVY